MKSNICNNNEVESNFIKIYFSHMQTFIGVDSILHAILEFKMKFFSIWYEIYSHFTHVFCFVLFLFLFCFFWLHPQHVEVLRPRIKPAPQQWSELQQQWQILNLLSHTHKFFNWGLDIIFLSIGFWHDYTWL